MKNSICKDCINKEICGKKSLQTCEHYDVVLTRGEIMNLLGSLQQENPSFVPALLSAVKKTYHINLAY
ncbi:MAG TPA: hypothetical protein PK544_08320 [Spirochaetota bacterium]|nr:hypothetical protein [Spirochaetota bacterium]HPJ39364.1 hypothetical protein [Spirochaetota bacterium]HPQ53812.1 hypothetical protein [Spirochaetota bacterium]